MGDRFYLEQQKHKPKRVLKKDVIGDVTHTLKGIEVDGLDRLTIKALNDLNQAIKDAYWEL